MEPSLPAPILVCLRQALRHLYDPADLRRNPLFVRLIGEERAGPLALQELLIAEIEALKPETQLAPYADAWRVYRVLTHRFVEQFTQHEVATNLGLSIRQLRREEQRALQVLGDHLLRRYPEQLAAASKDTEEADDAGETALELVSEAREMEWLERSVPSAPTDIAALVETIIEMAQPMLAPLSVQTHLNIAAELPSALIQATTVRQALLSLIIAAARAVPGGSINIKIEGDPSAIEITLCSDAGDPGCHPQALEEAISIARQLLALSAGTLDELTQGQADCEVWLRLRLPAAHTPTVLVIDDNADALRLYERYLAQHPYRFIGLREPEHALERALQTAPAAIVLDVMLPGIDGWELLGRLREAPSTRAIPVIVSTILPQEDFALTLGAAAFLRKPFTQMQLLETLTQVLNSDQDRP